MTIPDDVMKAAVNAVNEAIRDERTGLAVKMSIKHQPFYEFVARAIMAERSRKVTAFLDGILADLEAMERVREGARSRFGQVWAGSYVAETIAALKQEAER